MADEALAAYQSYRLLSEGNAVPCTTEGSTSDSKCALRISAGSACDKKEIGAKHKEYP